MANSVVSLSCVECGSSAVQRVPAIVRGQNSSGVNLGAGLGVGEVGGQAAGGVGISATRTRTATDLARTLAPPAKPEKTATKPPDGATSKILSLLFGIAAAYNWFWFARGEHDRMWTAIVLTVIMIGLYVAFLGSRGGGQGHGGMDPSQVDQAKMADWRESMDRWDRLCYCSKCDHVYDPLNGRSARPDQMANLL